MKTGHYFFSTIVIIIVFFFIGCEKENEYAYVDFSKKINTSKQVQPSDSLPKLRVAVAAMISPKETLVYYEELLNYIGHELKYEIELIQRKTYSEINELFPKRMIELAFVCSGPYANGKEKYGFEGIATPIVRGEPYYQSYLIVQKESVYHSLNDLKGKVFAFTDPDSNTGALVPKFWLLQQGKSSDSFFNRTTYTYSHDNSILAVSKGRVDGATVDGHIWEYYNVKIPYLTAQTRVIRKSENFGSPPLVASAFLDPKLKSRIQKIILSMHRSENGRKLLESIMIERFESPQEGWYKNIRTMYTQIHRKK